MMGRPRLPLLQSNVSTLGARLSPALTCGCSDAWPHAHIGQMGCECGEYMRMNGPAPQPEYASGARFKFFIQSQGMISLDEARRGCAWGYRCIWFGQVGKLCVTVILCDWAQEPVHVIEMTNVWYTSISERKLAWARRLRLNRLRRFQVHSMLCYDGLLIAVLAPTSLAHTTTPKTSLTT